MATPEAGISAFVASTANQSPVAEDDAVSGANAGDFPVNYVKQGNQGGSQAVELSNGLIAVVWTSGDGGDDPDGTGIKARIFGADGSGAVAEFLVNAQTEGVQRSPQVTALSDGRFAVAWTSSGGDSPGIKLRIFDADGSAASDELIVNQDTSGSKNSPGITTLANGQPAIVWGSQIDGVDTIMARIFEEAGTPAADAFEIDRGFNETGDFGGDFVQLGNPSIAATGEGGFVVSYSGVGVFGGFSTNLYIKLKTFDADQTLIRDAHVGIDGDAYQPSLATLPDGRVAYTFFAWPDDIPRGIYGNFASDVVSVGRNLGQPQVAGLADGRVVYTWRSDSDLADGSGTAIKARVYDSATRNPVGPEFLVNELTNGDQAAPAVTGLRNGGFLVTWTSEDAVNDTSGTGISARFFDSEGNPGVGFITDEDTPYVFAPEDLLSNDSDPDGDDLNISAVSATSAAGASLILNPDGTIAYDPSASAQLNALEDGASAVDTFTYMVTDGSLNDTATVSIVVRGRDDVSDIPFAEDDAVTVSGNVLDYYGKDCFRIGARNEGTDLLENDTGAQAIVQVNGAAISEGVWFAGDNGGEFRVFAEGVVDFRNQGVKVADGVTTGFSYTARDGTAADTAAVSLSVDAGADIAKADVFEISEVKLAAAGSDWLRLAAKYDGTGLFANDLGVDEIHFINDRPLSDRTWFDGDNGGQFRVFPGGVVDFRSRGDTVDVGDTTGFTYGVWQDGVLDTATVSMTIKLASPPPGLVQIKGIKAGDWSGWSVSSAGDVDGDGLDDVIIGANGASPDGANKAGESFLVFGAALAAEKAGAGVIDLDGLVREAGVLIEGIDSSDYSGTSVSSAGDVDGDGLDDVIIGAYLADPDGIYNAGESYVVFGEALAAEKAGAGVIDLDGLVREVGVLIKGIDPSDYSGFSVSSAGDVDGDGLHDVIIGSSGADPDDIYSAGESYVVFGAALASENVDDGVIDLNGQVRTEGVPIKGIDKGDRSGYSVSSAGDVDGDGLDDVVIGALIADPDGTENAGESYLVFGAALAAEKADDGVIDLNGLARTEGVLIKGIDAADQSGASVSSAGDVDGDGLDDVIIGAPLADPDGVDRAGESYLVFGAALTAEKTGDGVIDLNGLARTKGVLIKGIGAEELSGYSVSSAGDVDGDGLDDVIIGASGAGPDGASNAGESYLVFGAALAAEKAGDGVIDLDGLARTEGLLIKGIAAEDQSGASVSSAGDVDGDGLDDVIIGARLADPDGVDSAGESYLILGAMLSAEKFDDGIIDLGDWFL